VGAFAQPVNDKFTKPDRLTGLTGSTTGTTVGATKQPGEPAHAKVDGLGSSIWFRWKAPYSAWITFTTAGSSFDTVLAAYTGTALTSLTPIASNDDSAVGVMTSLIHFKAVQGTDYAVVVDGALGEQGDVALGWFSQPLNDDFEDYQRVEGYSGVVNGTSVGATLENGETPPGDPDVGGTVWFGWPSTISAPVTFSTAGSDFDTVLEVYTGNSIDGLTLVASNDNMGEDPTSEVSWNAEVGGRYRIVIGGRSAATGDYTLSWSQLVPPPPNDDFANAQPLSGFTGQTLGTTDGATRQAGEPAHAEGETGHTVWFSWTGSREGRVRFSTSRSLFPTVLVAYSGTALNALTPLARGDEGAVAAEVSFLVKEGQTYWLALDGQAGAGGAYVLQWTYDDLKTDNNMFSSASTITGFSGHILGENYYADTEPGEPYHADDPGGRSVWYEWVAPLDFRVEFNTLGSNFDTLLAVYTGVDPITGLTTVAANDDDDPVLTSRVGFDAVAGTTYHIAVDASTDLGQKNPEIGMVVLSWRPSDTDFLGLFPSTGMAGSRIRICGRDLESTASVSFNGTELPFFLQNGSLVVTITPTTPDGPVTVTDTSGAIRVSQNSFTLLPGTPPSLRITRVTPTTVRIAWPSEFATLRLESTADLDDRSWVPWPGAKEANGEFFLLDEIHPTLPARYYRLQEP
jgi:hypothetical protein